MELYTNPANLFVAGFIGSPEINLVDATLGGSDAVTASGVKLPLPAKLAKGASAKLVYGIRPQHITFGKGGVPGSITLVEPTGEDQEVVVRIGEQDVSVVIRGGKPLEVGQQVKLAIDVEKVLLFDKATGERLA